MLSVKNHSVRRRLDDRLAHLKPTDRFARPKKGWIRAIRDALGMNGVQFAARMGVAWQSMDDIEKSEASDAITLRTLRRAAEALDCELVYALVPRTSLQQSVDERAAALALEALARVDQTMTLEDQAVTGDIRERLNDYIQDHIRDRDLWAA